jgi:hypothetical protein
MRSTVLRWAAGLSVCSAVLLAVTPAMAGPPYLSDDPEPTDYKHYEIYVFSNGFVTRDGTSGAGGLDINYGGAPNLQLTATLPVAYDFPALGAASAGPGNIELAAKYRFLTQQNFGLDVAVFPRVFLPSPSSNVGDAHASLLLPIWVQKDWGDWSAFGGGGCELNRGGNSQNFCEAGLVVTRQLTKALQVGFEIFHQTPDTQSGLTMTSLGAGARYDLNDNFHLLGYLGRGIENTDATDRLNWYCAVLFTF